jgi:prefoldin subunit 5
MASTTSGATHVPGCGTVRWHNSQETRLAVQRFQQALSHHKRELTNLLNLRSEYSVLGDQLQVLPQAISHHTMVPFGTQAMFPGKLVRTNEITVLLGDNYFVKCSAHHARGIVGRRLDVIERKIAAAEKQVQELQLRVAHALEMSSNEGVCEIMEPYDGEDEADASKGKSDSAAASSSRDLDEEEDRSNIEETEARLRFMFGNEDEWVDDEDGSSNDGGDNQSGAAQVSFAERSSDVVGYANHDGDGHYDDDDDNIEAGISDDDVQVDSGVDSRYLADFTASVQSRHDASQQASAARQTIPIVTNPAQLYDRLFSPVAPQTNAASSSHLNQTRASSQRSTFQPPNAHAGQSAPPASSSIAAANAAFTGRIVEKSEPDLLASASCSFKPPFTPQPTFLLHPSSHATGRPLLLAILLMRTHLKGSQNSSNPCKNNKFGRILEPYMG